MLSPGPRPAIGTFPYPGRTVAEVDADHAKAASFNAPVLAWCPPDRREDYRILARKLGATEARKIIEAAYIDRRPQSLHNFTSNHTDTHNAFPAAPNSHAGSRAVIQRIGGAAPIDPPSHIARYNP